MARRRRAVDEVHRMVEDQARRGPFTAQELCAEIGFTSNRARQVLYQLETEGRVVRLGKRRSLRGKPAELWGLPGTELTEEQRAPSGPAAPRQVRRAPAARPPARPAARRGEGASALGSLLAILERGLQIVGPGGETYRISLMEPSPRGEETP